MKGRKIYVLIRCFFFFEWLECRGELKIDEKGMRNRIKIEQGEEIEEISFLLGGLYLTRVSFWFVRKREC